DALAKRESGSRRVALPIAANRSARGGCFAYSGILDGISGRLPGRRNTARRVFATAFAALGRSPYEERPERDQKDREGDDGGRQRDRQRDRQTDGDQEGHHYPH